jgi:hypothetical protein
MSERQSLFLAIEGPSSVGKTTVTDLLHAELTSRGVLAMTTKPGPNTRALPRPEWIPTARPAGWTGLGRHDQAEWPRPARSAGGRPDALDPATSTTNPLSGRVVDAVGRPWPVEVFAGPDHGPKAAPVGCQRPPLVTGLDEQTYVG